MKPADVESLERATVEGVAPNQLLEIAGWLVPLDDGFIGRAKSAAPLRHDIGPSAISEIEAAYWTEGLTPQFRIADKPGLKAVREALETRGYVPHTPTMVEVGDVDRLARLRDTPGDLLEEPDEAWGGVFLGEGFDPEEGKSRVANLTRSPDAMYGCVRENGRTVAVGCVTFNHGWAAIHGMRTDADKRGRGLASQVLAALGRAAQARGVERIFLQVQEGNKDARSLYRKAGFNPVWPYRYWAR